MHGAQGIGLLAGGFVAAVAAAWHVSLPIHFGIVAMLGAAAGLLSTWGLPQPAATGGRARILARPDRRLVLLGIVAFCAFLIDGGASNWVAIHLRSEHHATPAAAAAGYTCFTLALVVVRLGGDRLVLRFSRLRVVQSCGSIAAAGAVLVVFAPTTATAFAGWILVGAGLALLAPTVLGAAPGRGTTAPATAIAAVTTLGYLGSFTGPPLIGALAGLTTLSTALALLALAATATVLLAPLALTSWAGRGRSYDWA